MHELLSLSHRYYSSPPFYRWGHWSSTGQWLTWGNTAGHQQSQDWTQIFESLEPESFPLGAVASLWRTECLNEAGVVVQAEENMTRHAQVGVMGSVLQVILLSRFFCYSTSHSEGVLMWEERQQVGGLAPSQPWPPSGFVSSCVTVQTDHGKWSPHCLLSWAAAKRCEVCARSSKWSRANLHPTGICSPTSGK